MCGRFTSATPPDELARLFSAEWRAETLLRPSYNVAPTNDIWVVADDGGTRRLDAFHWGLVPPWAKDPGIGSRMINARAETLAEKASYKRPFAKRRCIIPVDGFYEWAKVPDRKTKQPMYLHSRSGEPLALAGLWERWKPKDQPDEPPLRSATIITGRPNDAVARIHDRMPAILPASAWDTWLDPANDDLELLGQLLVPAPSELLVIEPVSTAVNKVANKGPDLIRPVDPETGEFLDDESGPVSATDPDA